MWSLIKTDSLIERAKKSRDRETVKNEVIVYGTHVHTHSGRWRGDA